MSMTFDSATRSAARVEYPRKADADPSRGAANRDKERERNFRRCKYSIVHYNFQSPLVPRCILTGKMTKLWLLLAACGILYAADDAMRDTASSELRPMIERFSADLRSLTRTYPIRVSATRRARFERFFQENEAALGKVNFESLGQDGRIDYLLFRNYLRHERDQLALDGRQMTEMEPLIPFADSIIALEEARRKMQPPDPKKAAATLVESLKRLEAARKANADAAKVKPAVANRAALRLAGLRNNLKDWFNFYNGYDPVFTWWVSEPYKEFDQALDSYAKFLREKLAGVRAGGTDDIVGDPVGRQALLNDLEYNMIPYTPEELISLARKELAWCEQEMTRASRELNFGDNWHQALEFVKNQYVDPGKQPEMVRGLAQEAIEYVEKNDLVTVPALAKEDWWEEMLSPERQLTSPFFLGGEVILVSFPTDTMTNEQKLMSMRGNNIHFSRATVFHELIPGHHLQAFMTARYRTYRALFSTPFWTEGNAFYWEMLLWDRGFPRGPEDRIGMLFWRMHRCARIIFSLSFHLGAMTPQQSIDFLVERVGFERANAAAEVRRSFDGSYEPIYQCAYMLGALQFYALHQELVGAGKMTDKAFHDAILKENRIPVEMIRADLARQKLTSDFRSSWRFWK
jgi:uncharacterized protein (DUF885 family)